MKKVITLIFLWLGMAGLNADVYEDYIRDYCDIAVKQQEEYGIPASITLAQGLLESGAGRSRLAREGNNHFGIKCHSGWTGNTMLRDDDAPNECFRVYATVEESYTDHSKFLKRERYRRLFELEPTDYAGWAQGLRACGYATDPQYPDKLTAIIERYALFGYDTPGVIDETLNFIREAISLSHPIKKGRGLHYVIALPGDTYKSLGKEFGISENKLKEYNDDKKGRNLKEWQEVYLEPKNTRGPEGINTVTIGEGESMWSISQRYGMKLESLKKLNKKAKDKSGEVLVVH